MIRASILALACLTTAPLASAPAFASDAVVLRESLSVEGSHITLGDLFEINGAAAATVVARAPAPGGRQSLDVNYVRQLATENGLDWANATGLRRLTVTRASRTISADVLTDVLEGELFALEGTNHEVRLANSAMTLHAPLNTAGNLRIVSMHYDNRSGMLAAEMTAYDGAEPVRVTGRAYATVDIPVLARPVAAGEEITGDHISWVAHRADRLRPDAVLDPNDIIGREGRRALRPNEPLRAYDLQLPLMVERGELVTLVLEAPGLQLSVRARAMENAGDGEMARFVNLQSNRTVEALVDGPGRARVGLSPAASF